MSGSPRGASAAHLRTVPARALVAVLAVIAVSAALLLPSRPAAAAYVTPPVPARSALENTIIAVVLAELNLERRLNGKPALAMDPHLQLSARRHDVMMARYNTMSHQLPTEAPLGDRVTAAGYRWSWAGENVAYNSDRSSTGALTLQRMMYNEKAPNNGHRLNILSTNYQQVGVDVLIDLAHGRLWLTTDFGRH